MTTSRRRRRDRSNLWGSEALTSATRTSSAVADAGIDTLFINGWARMDFVGQRPAGRLDPVLVVKPPGAVRPRASAFTGSVIGFAVQTFNPSFDDVLRRHVLPPVHPGTPNNFLAQ
jgi:hypothetical protein